MIQVSDSAQPVTPETLMGRHQWTNLDCLTRDSTRDDQTDNDSIQVAEYVLKRVHAPSPDKALSYKIVS